MKSEKRITVEQSLFINPDSFASLEKAAEAFLINSLRYRQEDLKVLHKTKGVVTISFKDLKSNPYIFTFIESPSSDLTEIYHRATQQALLQDMDKGYTHAVVSNFRVHAVFDLNKELFSLSETSAKNEDKFTSIFGAPVRTTSNDHAARTNKREENTKIKLVLPFLQNVLGYQMDDLDFEYNVQNKRADIAIFIDEKLSLLIEVKDQNENLDNHVTQAVEYGWKKQIDYVVLTNGSEYRVYATFVKGLVNPPDRLILRETVRSLERANSPFTQALNRDQVPTFERLHRLKQKLRPRVTEGDLIAVLNQSTLGLYDLLISQFKARYKSDTKFKTKIDHWASEVKLDIKDKRLVDKLCKEGAYSLINRVLFYRISEDRGPSAPSVTEATLTQWRKMVEKPSAILKKLFQSASREYQSFYNSPLFNSVTYDDVNWDEELIFRILTKFSSVDFAKVDNDLIGTAYEKHIPEQERKDLGQFYTPQFIVKYLIERTKPTVDDKIFDPSCGSGAFLTTVMKELITSGVDPSTAIENNIFGQDINPFAIQLSTMNLLLLTLGSTKKPKTINLLAADSLLDKQVGKSDLFKEHFSESSKRNVSLASQYNRQNGPFDVILGNPPYRCFGLRSNKALKETYQEYLRDRWTGSAQYKISYYPLFIEKSIELLKDQGRLGFILPDSYLVGKHFSKVREFILKTCKIAEIVFCKENFWEDAEVGCPTMIVLQKESDAAARSNNTIIVKLAGNENDIKSRTFVSNKIKQKVYETTLLNRFELYFDKVSYDLVVQMRKNATARFRDVVTGHTGIRAAKDVGKENIISNTKENSMYERALHSGSEVKPFSIDYDGGYVRLDKKLLCSGGWDSKIIGAPKILLRQTGDSLQCAIDENGYYHLNNVHSISPNKPEVCLEWVCLTLNSEVMNRFYHIISMELGRPMAQVDIDQLEDLPFVKPTEAQIVEAKQLYLKLSNSKQNSRLFEDAKDRANQLVAKAYGISSPDLKAIRKVLKSKKLAA